MVATLVYPDIPYHTLLASTAARRPEATALVFHDRPVSYRTLDEASSQVAHALLAMGVSKGDRVGLLLPTCPEYVIAFFGVTRAGAVPSPLNPSYREREIRYQVEEAGASVLIVHASLVDVARRVQNDLPHLRLLLAGGRAEGAMHLEDAMAGHPTTPPEVNIALDDLAALPFSSGTTGTAKGVMLTQRNLVCNAVQFGRGTGTTERDVILIFLPAYHIYGVSLLTFAAWAGACCVLMQRFDLGQMVKLIQEEGATELFVVPPVMLALANAPGLDPAAFRSLRFIMSAAAPLAAEVARTVQERLGVPVIQAYGMTEASPMTHIIPQSEWGTIDGNVGSPGVDTQCRIVDLETGERVLPPGEVGEVTISGPQIMAGYWNAPAETARALRNGWLHTGDVGYEDEHGRLHLVDRLKEMIKYKAFSIAPAELEALLLEHPAVADCAVTAQPDEECGEVPRAFVVLREGAGATPEEIQRWVADQVAGYKQIHRIDIIDAIPRTASGKVLRRQLRTLA